MLQGSRRGFAMVGRWSHYKGFDIGLDAWRNLPDAIRKEHPLEVWQRIGSDHPPFEDESLVWHSGGFAWEEVAEMLSRVAYVLLPYRSASQSGVQVLAQQCGARVIYTDLPGLREFVALGDVAVNSVEPTRWTQAMRDALDELPYVGEAITFTSRGYRDQLAQAVNQMGQLVKKVHRGDA